jgi:hypothetical protein
MEKIEMPDWIVHVLVAWTLCTILGFKYKQFNTPNTVIAMIGSLLPDLFKVVIPLEYLGIYIGDFIYPIHLPIGSLIIASIIALFFKERKIVFLFLLFGVFPHYLLDLFLVNLNGGMTLLFPFSWQRLEFGIIPVDDYNITIITIILALVVYTASKTIKKSPDSI